MKIKELDISARARACLLNAGYSEVNEILNLSDEELMSIRNFNDRCVKEIRDLIDKIYVDGFSKKNDLDGFSSEVYLIPIRELDLNLRALNCLKRANIDIVRELCIKSSGEMIQIRHLGQKSYDEIIGTLEDLGVQLRPEYEDSFLYGYPNRIRDIAIKKEDGWEYRLYVESVVVNYEWLIEFRKNPKEAFCSEMELESAEELIEFIRKRINEIMPLVETFSMAINEKAVEAFGAPGEPGNEVAIIEAVDLLMNVYKDMIKWGNKIESIRVIDKFKDVSNKLATLSEELCKNIDRFYYKCVVASKMFNSYIAGEISNEQCHIDLKIDFEFDTSILNEAIEILALEYDEEEINEEFFNEDIRDDELINEDLLGDDKFSEEIELDENIRSKSNEVLSIKEQEKYMKTKDFINFYNVISEKSKRRMF